MSKNELIGTLSKSFYKTKFWAIKNSPKLLTIAGTAGVAGGFILGCKASMKASKVNQNNKERIIEARKDETETRGKTLVKAHAQNALEWAKLYGPSVALTVGSLGCFWKSTGILNERNAALAAAYATVSESYDKYREYVGSHYGEEADTNAFLGIEEEEVEEIKMDSKGKEKKVKGVNRNVTHNLMYDRWFDESNPHYRKEMNYNRDFIVGVQNLMDRQLKHDGFLYLNQVYDALGIPMTKYGQTIGWIYNPLSDKYNNCVDFGIFEDTDTKRLFVNGHERCIRLSFNVDGNILDDPHICDYMNK